MIKIIHGDCLEEMHDIQDKSIDAIICDLPYGTTQCKWDSVIPFEPMWDHLSRVIKDNGAIVLFGRQPFTTKLIASNIDMFRQTWVWDKVIGVNFMNARKMHTQGFEDIIVFYKKLPTYNPQMEEGTPYTDHRVSIARIASETLGHRAPYSKIENKGERYPRGIVRISGRNNSNVHPTQKPLELMEYLVNTYTEEGDTVLDFTSGSGSTGLACKNLGRKFIGIEREEKYVEISKVRLGLKRRKVVRRKKV